MGSGRDESEDVRVLDVPDERRFVLMVGDTPAGSIEYARSSDAIYLIHTKVDPSFEGRGLGTRLIAGALDDVRARKLGVVPVCRFVRAYLARHPDDADLIVEPEPR